MIKTIIFILLILISVLFFVRVKEPQIPSYYEIIKDKANIPIVKILVFENLDNCEIAIEDDFLILNAKEDAFRQVKGGVKKAMISYLEKESGFIISTSKIKDNLKVKEFILRTITGKAIKINDRFYLGDLLFRVTKEGKFYITNCLELETYILGVLPGETFEDFDLDAIKAQAIASRTYALSEIQDHKNDPWHMKSTTRSQVFIGISALKEKLKRAVLETRGIVMMDREKIFRAYFSSSCGGATADLVSLPWEKDIASVMIGRECDNCKKSKPNNFYWEAKFPKSQVLTALKAYGIKDLTGIVDFNISNKDNYGRVLELEIGDGEMKFLVNALRFRVEILKETTKLRSCMFQVSIEGQNIVFKGAGWGHGVGLCQYGSQAMAKEGRSYTDILNFYFSGVKFYRFYQ
jgi:stage II sporulation protein D